MNQMTAEQVFSRMEEAIRNIFVTAQGVKWEDQKVYEMWLAQSYKYVKFTTRQLAFASAMTNPETEDEFHWRLIEEAKEEKRHERLAAHDLKAFGKVPNDFPEMPHTSFFYQTLNYMIERHNPIVILGYSLTLEGFAALHGKDLLAAVLPHYGEQAITFLKLHAEVDVDHFNNALPYLKACPEDKLPIIFRGIELCEAIYIGILNDISKHCA